MTNSADPDQLASSSEPSALALHCLQRQGISGFSRTRVKTGACLIQVNFYICLLRWPFNTDECLIQVAFNPCPSEPKYTLPLQTE